MILIEIHYLKFKKSYQLQLNFPRQGNSLSAKRQSNAYKRHIYQLEKTQHGILDADANDIIIVGDLDEIPNLEKINFKIIKKKLIFF